MSTEVSMRNFGKKAKKAYATLVLNRRFEGQTPKRIALDWGLPLWWVLEKISDAREEGDRRILCRKR